MRKIRFIFTMIALIVIGAALIVLGSKQSSSLSKDAIDLYDPDVNWSDIKVGDHIEMDIPILLDCYARYEKDGKDTQRFYCLPYYDQDAIEITNFIGVDVNNTSLFAQYDALVSDTFDWWNTPDLDLPDVETIHIDGIVQEMTQEQYEYHAEYLTDDLGYTEDEIEDTLYKYYIRPADKGESKILVIVGVICLLIGIGGTALTVVKKR